MKKTTYATIASLLLSSAAVAQSTTMSPVQSAIRPIEVGIKGGATFVSGYTNIPAQPTGIANLEIPRLENKGNGIGTGYTGGLFARFNNYNRKGFIQVELTYNRYVLKQKTNTTVDVNANPALAARLPLSFAPGLLNATVDITSESSIESFNVPVLFGRRLFNDRLRAYIGPTLLFVNRSEAKRTTQGQINPNTTIGFGSAIAIPATDETTNLLSKREASYLEVKRVTWALEAGVGISPLRFLDIDVRYAVPAGGVYLDSSIKGYLGIASVTVGLKIP